MAQPSALIAPVITRPAPVPTDPADRPPASVRAGSASASTPGAVSEERNRPPVPDRSASWAAASAVAALAAPLLGAARSFQSRNRSRGSSAPRGHGFLAAFAIVRPNLMVDDCSSAASRVSVMASIIRVSRSWRASRSRSAATPASSASALPSGLAGSAGIMSVIGPPRASR